VTLNYNERMLALRYAALLGLAVWVGGLITLGAAAAPAMFDVLGASGSVGRLQAAAVFGETLRRFHWITYGCGVVVVTSLAARAVLGPRPRRFAVRASIAAAMLAASAWVGQVVAPQIARAQREIGAPPSSLPENDPRRAAFGRQHRLSTTLELVPLVGGLMLLFWELKE
jgi:uncharacterized protein DUF4149